MKRKNKRTRIKNIGIISTRISGTDGVSLEIEKWANVLERGGYKCFYLCGETDRPLEVCMVADECHFEHPDIRKIDRECFGTSLRSRGASSLIHGLRDYLKEKLYQFVDDFDIDALLCENVLAIPMNIPLGLALTEFLTETGFPTLAHHHDFYWERDRFLVNGVSDYLHQAFPPHLPCIQHVTINSIASQQLSYRKGISNLVVPNVHDFANPPPRATRGCQALRQHAGLDEDDLFILQPTRVVPRKWIERAIEIVYQMDLPNPTLVISHSATDEGDSYYQRIMEYAKNLNVRIVSIDQVIGIDTKNASNAEEKPYSIADAYRCADLVTYPSGYEGFGNAFLEAIYYKRPIVVNRYSIYVVDIEPKGFDIIEIEGFVGKATVEKIFEVLKNEKRRKTMVEKNYELGLQFFSYEVLEKSLRFLIHTMRMQSRQMI